jgi:hypothetical protein
MWWPARSGAEAGLPQVPTVGAAQGDVNKMSHRADVSEPVFQAEVRWERVGDGGQWQPGRGRERR